MGIIETVVGKTNKVTYYEIPPSIEYNGYWEWIYDTCESGVMDVLYVTLDDIENRNSEDSDYAQLKAPIDEEVFFSKKSNKIRIISIVGMFENRPVVVGIDLDEKYIFVTSRNSAPANVVKLAGALKLL